MAITSASFTNVKRRPLAAGVFIVTGTFTGPASYTSGGEALLNAIPQGWGINAVEALFLTPFVKASDGSTLDVAFDHNPVAATSQGKFRVATAVSPHAHDLLLVGGQAGGVAVQIDVDTAAAVFGKTAATNRTLAAGQGTKNIQQNAAVTTQSELAATTDISLYTCRFVCYGS